MEDNIGDLLYGAQVNVDIVSVVVAGIPHCRVVARSQCSVGDDGGCSTALCSCCGSHWLIEGNIHAGRVIDCHLGNAHDSIAVCCGGADTHVATIHLLRVKRGLRDCGLLCEGRLHCLGIESGGRRVGCIQVPRREILCYSPLPGQISLNRLALGHNQSSGVESRDFVDVSIECLAVESDIVANHLGYGAPWVVRGVFLSHISNAIHIGIQALCGGIKHEGEQNRCGGGRGQDLCRCLQYATGAILRIDAEPCCHIFYIHTHAVACNIGGETGEDWPSSEVARVAG